MTSVIESLTWTGPRCTACGTRLNPAAVKDRKQRLKSKSRRRRDEPSNLSGCTGCGHAMIAENGRLRDLTKEEAERVHVESWMKAVEQFVGNKTWG
jgi:hypothetical protein